MKKFFSYFINDTIRKDSVDYVKAQILVSILLLFVSFIFVYTIFFLANGIVFTAKALFNYVGIIAIGSTLLSLKRAKNVLIPLRVISITGLFLITISAALSGGFYSNDLFWYAISSTIAVMFISFKDGVFNAIVSFICIMSFYIIATFNLYTFPTNELTSGIHYKLANTLFITTIMFVLISIMVKGNNKLVTLLEEIRETNLREEISRDFHDQLGNKLASICHLAKVSRITLSADQRAEALNKIEIHANDVYNNFKDFIWSQNPHNNTLEEMFVYIKDFIEDYLKLSKTSLYINLSPETLPKKQLPQAVTNEIIPIVKEAVTNMYKHANAAALYFDYRYEGAALLLQLKDNGAGFDSNETSGGNGLDNIKKRAEKIGANLTIFSSEKGTTIQLVIKLPESGD